MFSEKRVANRQVEIQPPSRGCCKDCDDMEPCQRASLRNPRLKILFALFIFLMSGAIHANTEDRGVFRSVYAAGDVVLDTEPRSAFWHAAPAVYAEADSWGRMMPAYRTEIRSRWTKSNLYLLFACPYEELYLKPSPNAAEETYGLWNWDVAELFIGSDFHNIRRYKEFEVSPQREWVDLDINLDLPDHAVGWNWNSGFQVAARIDPRVKIWYGAMRIPFAALATHPPVTGRNYRANLFRSQGPPNRRKSIAWKAPMNDTFHVPEKFGLLELVSDKSK